MLLPSGRVLLSSGASLRLRRVRLRSVRRRSRTGVFLATGGGRGLLEWTLGLTDGGGLLRVLLLVVLVEAHVAKRILAVQCRVIRLARSERSAGLAGGLPESAVA